MSLYSAQTKLVFDSKFCEIICDLGTIDETIIETKDQFSRKLTIEVKFFQRNSLKKIK